MNPTKEQRAMMAADLWMRAATMTFRGEADCAPSVSTCAEFVIERDDPEDYYREGLTSCGLSPADIDAAVAAIADGRHPADSLPGRVEKMRSDLAEEIDTVGGGSDDGIHAFGERMACATFLSILGCKVTP